MADIIKESIKKAMIKKALKESFPNKEKTLASRKYDYVGDEKSPSDWNPSEDNDLEIDYPAYVNVTFHRSKLVLLKNWIGSLDREESVSHLNEEVRDVTIHAVQDFYSHLSKALERKTKVRVVSNPYANLTEEEEKLLAECFED